MKNDLSTFVPMATEGYYDLDFLTDRVGEGVEEIGSVLETNFLQASGSRLQLILNAQAAGVMFLTGHRIFGDISQLKPATAR